MGSITNYDDICKCCGLDAMFNNYYYRTGEDDKHSYLMVIEDGKAKYLKGEFHYMYDTECDGENKGIANDSSAVFEEILSMN